MFPEGMAVVAHNPANTLKQRMKTPSLVIIEFVLGTLPHIGTTGEVLRLSLAQNYSVTPHKLHHELIFFDINDADQLEEHTAHVSDTVKRLSQR